MFCVIVITVWKGFPFYGLVILAALQTVPRTCTRRPASTARRPGPASAT